MSKKHFILIGILILAFLLRVPCLKFLPAGFNPDEANTGYTAYSILKTGKDEWGEFLPLAPRSYGDYRAPLYTYLTIPSIAIFGLTEFATRLPAALLGTLAVLVTFLWLRHLFHESKYSSLPYLSAMLIAISPWHIQLSRGAFETSLPVLIVPLFLLTLQKKHYLFSTIVFTLGLFSYYSARFFFPIFVSALFLLHKNTLSSKSDRFKVYFPIFTAILVVLLWSFVNNSSTRAADVAITNPTDHWQAVSDRRFEAVTAGLPDPIARIFVNKAAYVAQTFTRNYISLLSPYFFFVQGAGEPFYGISPGRPLVYLIELPLILISLIYIFRNNLAKSYPFSLFIIWILLAPVPAALSKGIGFAANRASLFLPVVEIFAALGVVVFISYVKNNLLRGVLIIIFIFSGLGFLEDYVFHSPQAVASAMSYGWRDIGEYLIVNQSNYKQVIISRNFSEPQMMLAFFLSMDPKLVQRESKSWLEYESRGLKFVDQLPEYKLDKYIFKHLEPEDFRKESTLIIGKAQDIPITEKVVYQINYPDNSPAVKFVSSDQKQTPTQN